MPIHPDLRRAVYSRPWWRLQAARVEARAGGRCECRGHCGRLHKAGEGRCEAVRAGPSDKLFGVAHLNHDSGARVDDDKLIFLCAACHLRFDIAQHVQARLRNYLMRLEAAGQGRLL